MINNMQELIKKLTIGTQNRVTGQTDMNRHSSRSHSIFTVIIEMCENVGGQNKIRVGKLNLVDLAGSERQSKTNAVGERFVEAVNINQSLSTLGMNKCIKKKFNAQYPLKLLIVFNCFSYLKFLI